MSQKIAAEDCPKAWSGLITEQLPVVVVREYEEERDKAGVERMEMQCEVTGQRSGPDNKKRKKKDKNKKKAFLVTDLLGDPLCRVRSFSSHVMLVAEWGEGGEIVGVIRGCIKRVKIRGNNDNPSSSSSEYVTAANVLGLRVSPSHRFSPPPPPPPPPNVLGACVLRRCGAKHASHVKTFASLSLES